MIDLDEYTKEELQAYIDGRGCEAIENAYCAYICCNNPDHDTKHWDWLYEAVSSELQYRLERDI